MAAIHWLRPVSGGFATGSDWSGGHAPGSADDALIDAAGGGAYTVTVSANATVRSVATAAEATLKITAGTFVASQASGGGANAGLIAIAAGAKLTLSGTLANTGVVELQGVSQTVLPYLQVGAGALTLTGGGEVLMASTLVAPYQPCPPAYSCDRIEGGAGARLTNIDNTIVGAGYIGLGGLALDNAAGGVIDASLDTDLVLNTGQLIVNRGLIESTGAGGLYIAHCDVDNSAGGEIFANGGRLYLTDSRLTGGTLNSAGDGFIYCDHQAIVLDGASKGAVTNLGYVFVSFDSVLTLIGAIDNVGRIGVSDGSKASTLRIDAAGVTLSGGGRIDLQGTDADTGIVGASAGATLDNLDNTIDGQGRIGEGSLRLVNAAGGVIDADRSLALTIDTGAVALVNAGLIEASGTSELIVSGASIDSRTGGEILASGKATVALQGATLTGGTVSTMDAGVIRVVSGADVLDGRGTGIVLDATIDIAIGATLTLEGVIDNAGLIALPTGQNAGTLSVAGTTTLTGGGTISLGGTAASLIAGAGAGAGLINQGDTIEGAGRIGGGDLRLVNRAGGLIEGTGPRLLTIDTGTTTVVNAGRIVSGAGGVTIEGALRNESVLEADGAALRVAGAVTGGGVAVIDGGRLAFAAAFSQHVSFGAGGGVLELARSQDFAATIAGFSVDGGATLDLDDIAFPGAGAAGYSGTWQRGVLTVSDGEHTASIHLAGDYRDTVFTLARDGHGGTLVTATTPAIPTHRFLAAAASLTAGAGGAERVGPHSESAGPPRLARPHTAAA